MAIEMFFCYARKDKKLLAELIKHLTPWQRADVIAMWHDKDLNAGQEWEREISAHMDSADIILLLVSPDFMASDYCYSVEMKRAMARYQRREVCLVPIILRPVDWKQTPFGMLQALPTDGKAVTTWRNRDEALYDIVQGLKRMLLAGCGSPLRSEENRTALATLAALPDTPPPDMGGPSGAYADAGAGARAVSGDAASPPARTNLSATSPRVSHFPPWLAAPPLSRRSVLIGLAGVVLTTGTVEGVRWFQSEQKQQIGQSTPTTQPTASVNPTSTTQPTTPANPTSTTQVPTSGQGKLLYTYRGHSNIVSSVSWSPHGTSIVSGSYDKTAHVWDAKTGTASQTYRGHMDKIQAVAWSPQGTYIASASSDKTAQVWSPSGVMLTTYKGHSDVVTAVAWSPDGKQIASASYDGTVQIWEAMSGNHIFTYPTGGPSPNRIVAVAWSSDGAYIASGSANELDIWNASTGVNQVSAGAGGLPALAWSPVDKLLAVGGFYMSVSVEDIRGGQVGNSYLDATTATTLCVAWSPDGQLIAFGGTDNTARVWNPADTSPAPQAFTYRGHKAPVRGVTWSSDSKYVASCSEDQTVQVWQGK